ncbi:phenylacetate--CoA ligase family protein [Elusimicrobiota bacterium]
MLYLTGSRDDMNSIIRQIAMISRINRSQWKDRSYFTNLQNRGISKLINYAYENNGFYKKKLDRSGIKPGDINTIDDLRKLPVTTRQELQETGREELISRSYIDRNKNIILTTSGTTHMPLQILLSRQDQYIKEAHWLRILKQWGIRIKDKRFCIAGQNIVGLPKSWHRYLHLYSKEFCTIFKDQDEIFESFIKCEPNIVTGFTGAILILAKMVEDNRNAVKKYPKLVSTTSQMLYDDEREYIQTVFKAGVMDVYATTENGFIAWECNKHEGYHVDAENVIVEFLKDNEPVSAGELGDIIVTNLNSYAMPFIRYKTGDMGIRKEGVCSCGRGLPLMGKVMGRRGDFIKTPAGSIFSPHIISSIMKNIKGIKQYQVVQRSIDKLIVMIKKDKEDIRDIEQQIETEFRKTLGQDIEILVSEVDGFNKNNELKTRRIFSQVDLNDGGY